MSNTFYAVPTTNLGQQCILSANVRLETESGNKSEKDEITKFTQIVDEVTDEVKNSLMQIQLSTDILERKLPNSDDAVSKKELEQINTGVGSLDKTMENLYYLPATVLNFRKIGVEEVWERMVSPYSNSVRDGVYDTEKIDTEEDEGKEVKSEKFIHMLAMQIVNEMKNCLMQIQLSADILERKLSNFSKSISNYIKSINRSVNLMDEAMASLLFYS